MFLPTHRTDFKAFIKGSLNCDLKYVAGQARMDFGWQRLTFHFEQIIFLKISDNSWLWCLGLQCVQKFGFDYLYLVIFGDFQNNFRVQNRLVGSPFGLGLLGNYENSDLLAENHFENLQK